MLRLSSIFTIKCSPRFLKHQFPSALCLFATLLSGLPANAVAVPMLQFLDLATTIVGNPNDDTGFYSFDPNNVGENKFWGLDEYTTLSDAGKRIVGRGAFVINPGPAQAISIRQVPDGLATKASSLVGLDRAEVFFHVTGKYQLTEAGVVTYTIFEHDIANFADSTNANTFTDRGNATTFTSFDVTNFLQQRFFHPAGENLDSEEGSGPKGTKTTRPRGPHSEVKTLAAGTYGFNFDLSSSADAQGFAEAQAAIQRAGFLLSVAAIPVPVSEPSSILLLIAALVGFAGSTSFRTTGPLSSRILAKGRCKRGAAARAV